ncbi:MAG: ABC transporter substrate-binding protein [Clostridiales Family XIII bacterium]|jgi:peptide/nickel transport system substrate-binding protein|nr:ABC transporter substrate-binding protein [Clostridiales Family XIII bacterium]
MKTKFKKAAHRVLAFTFALMMLFVLMSWLSGCGSKDDGGSGSATAEETLKFGLPNEIGSLDSAFAYDFTTNPVVTNISEGLLVLDADGELQPLIAESWEAVDETTYVYNIRDDVTFSDGSAMTMDDVLFSLERYGDEELASYLAWMYDNVESIEQTDDWQVTVKLSAPDAFWQYVPATTAGHIHKQAAVEEAGEEYGTVNAYPVATGPYPVSAWAAGGDITLTYNENYWRAGDSQPDVKEIIIQYIPEDTTRSLAAQSGQIDIDFSTPSDLVADIEASEKATIISPDCPGIGFLAFNCQTEPFNDVNARRAVASAINVAVLQESFVREEGTLTNYTMVPDVLFMFEPEKWDTFVESVTKYPYDLTQAKAYLAASAYPNGFDCTLLVDEYTISNNVALAIQSSLKEIGVNVTLDKRSNEEVTNQQFGEGIVDGVRPYQFGIFEWVSDFPDPAGVLNPLLIASNGGEGGSNAADYRNDKVDELLQQQLEEADSATRVDLLIEAEQIVQSEQPYYVLWQKSWLFTISTRIANPEDVLNANYIWNFSAYDIQFAE